jgi:DNA-binding transcriptional LysR family regulator
MELHQLRSFVAVAEESGVTPAAKRLFSTPSAVSTHVKAIEQELGVTLFGRTSRGMELTDVGRELLERARETLRSASELAHAAARLQNRVSGRVVLGTNASAELLRLADVVRGLERRHPDLELELRPTDSGRVVAALRDGTLDAGHVYGSLDGTGLSVERLAQVELVLAAPIDWDAPRVVDWRALAELPWIAPDDPCPFQTLIAERFDGLGVDYRRAATSGDDRARLELVRAGLGLTLLERGEAERGAAAGDLAVWETEPLELELSLVTLAERAGEPRLEALVSEVVDARCSAAPVSR